jgi:hypothetical protein
MPRGLGVRELGGRDVKEEWKGLDERRVLHGRPYKEEHKGMKEISVASTRFDGGIAAK